MKYLTILLPMMIITSAVADVDVTRKPYGSGQPGAYGAEPAETVTNDIAHAPQYLPGHPTSATIYPRVVEVPCTKTANGNLSCAGYQWTPALGRGEYLFIQPRIVEPPPAPRVIYKEVPVKKKGG